MDSRLKDLADRIRAHIQASPYSPTEVARLIGVDKSAVSRWTTGGRTPTMKNLIDLADLLGIEVMALWQGPEAIPSTPEQQAMLQRMAKMTPAQQQAFLVMAEMMAAKEIDS